MQAKQLAAIVLVCGALGVAAAGQAAQQATIGTPFRSVGDSFFEQMGTSWGFNVGGVSARFGGGSLGAPAFGQFAPGAGLSAGASLRGPAGSGNFNAGLGQGFSGGVAGGALSVTMMNGQTGYIGDVSLSPFVIGYVPVVGAGGWPLSGPWAPPAYPPYMLVPVENDPPPDPGTSGVGALRQRLSQAAAFPRRNLPLPPEPGLQAHPLQRMGVDDAAGLPALRAGGSSSATQAVPSVAEARRQHELDRQAENAEAQSLLDRGLAAEKAGKPNVAKIYYRQAANHAAGELQQEALRRLDGLTKKATP